MNEYIVVRPGFQLACRIKARASQPNGKLILRPSRNMMATVCRKLCGHRAMAAGPGCFEWCPIHTETPEGQPVHIKIPETTDENRKRKASN